MDAPDFSLWVVHRSLRIGEDRRFLKTPRELIKESLIGRNFRIDPGGTLIKWVVRTEGDRVTLLEKDNYWASPESRSLNYLEEQMISVPQVYDVSQEQDFIKLIEERRIHENDILDKKPLEYLVVGTAYGSIFSIHTVHRSLEGKEIEEIIWGGINKNELRHKLVESYSLRHLPEIFKFYSSKLNSRQVGNYK